MPNLKFYELDEIHKYDAYYNVIFGGRSTGKTVAVLKEVLKNWIDKGKASAYLRRYDTEITKSNGDRVFKALTDELKLVSEWTEGKWTDVMYSGHKFYLAKYDEKLDRMIMQDKPFCYAFALSNWERKKGGSYPDIDMIVYDEFMTRNRYLADEFVIFENIISTIIRQRDSLTVYLLGNTVSKYSPYFEEMGITNHATMQPGQIDFYEIENGDAINKIAVEYTYGVEDSQGNSGKPSDKFFTFKNQKLDMITGNAWEIDMFSHAPFKIEQRDILEIFFIRTLERNDEGEFILLQGNIILKDDAFFIYIHRKTTEIRGDDKMLYSMDLSPDINKEVSILKGGRNKISRQIAQVFKSNQIYFQTNEVGEMVRSFIHNSERFDALKL